jgi:hypothetical protein
MSRYGKQKIISQSILTTAYVMLPTKKIRNIRPNVVWVLGPVISYRSFIKLTTKSAPPVKDEWEIEEILANR